ncbi:ABC transporter ATP-binding protein [Pseudoteredinibacter isoporae]|uniref:Putative ABC transport system ATP-binding protein n=1 Tax=Pseudoteredinibacter isoporae TaxID=570281 RepID=A0A7X0JS31_9GAMM|nr:putative ABC transport system ATP-binding protein [Pseudoteredinibacter isoporae]
MKPASSSHAIIDTPATEAHPTSSVIQLNALNKVYQTGDLKVEALKSVSLQVQQNEFVAVMGSSGSGKSTMMNILGCLDKPSGGEYWLNGRNVAALDDAELASIRNHDIGFVFQTFHLLPRLSALQNVALPLRYADVERREAAAKAKAMLEKVGLGQRVNHLPHELSGGQRQRVAVARALINNPKIILADEPTGNLDSKTSLEIMSLLQELHRQGQTIVLITHEAEIAEFAQRLLIMRDGELLNE